MNTVKFVAISMLCAVMPVASSAQENLKHAINDFVSDKGLTQYIKSSYDMENAENNEGNIVSYFKRYVFELPNGKRKKLDKVLEGFEKDTNVAYQVKKKDAGVYEGAFPRIGYGEKLDKSVSIKAYLERNYCLMFVRDKQDSLRRYVYAISWSNQEKDDTLTGEIIEIYSPDPQKRVTVNVDDNAESLKRVTEAAHLMELAHLEENVTSKDDIKNSTDFLRRFTTLRVAYLNKDLRKHFAGWETLQMTLINKIVELCRNYGNLLNKEERIFCMRGIKSMITKTNDQFQKELLVLAISSLEK